MTMVHILALLVIWLTSFSLNADTTSAANGHDSYEEASQAIYNAFPETHRWLTPWPRIKERDWTQGHLKGSKHNYEAYLVNFLDDNNFNWGGVIVLTRDIVNSQTAYKVVAKSRLWPTDAEDPEGDIQRLDQVIIQDGYLIVASNDTKGCCLQSNSAFQFALRNKQIALVGHVEEVYPIGDEIKAIKDVEKIAGCSIDYETGKKVSWRRKNRVYKEAWFNFEKMPLVTLNDFLLRETPGAWLHLKGGFHCDEDYSKL